MLLDEFNVTAPPEQNAVGPAAVAVADGTEFTVTVFNADVVEQLLELVTTTV
jgi:hypothetical protein